MKIAWIAIAALFAVGVGTLAWFVAQPAEAADPGPEQIAEVKIVDPTYQPAKPACASCGDARHPTAPLNKEEYEALIKQYALEPVDQSDALDALCYYGVQTRVMMEQYGVGELDEGHASFLREEISRTHVIMSVRVTDENGVVRVSFDERRIPLDYRGHHAVDKAVDVTPPEISGTIKRVGLHHIWSRF
jgi:hypothetical protein